MASFMVGRVRFDNWTCPISILDVSDSFFDHAKVIILIRKTKPKW